MFRAISGYLLIIIVAVAAGIGLTVLSGQQYLAEQRLQVTQTSSAIASAIRQSVNEKVLITEGIAAVFEAEPDLSQNRFERIAGNLVEGVNEIINVAAAPDLVFRYVFPLEQNRAVLGLDLRERRDFMTAVDRATFLGTTVIDGPFDLVQGGHGFITRSPVLPPNGAARSPTIWGIVSLVIDRDQLFSSIAELQSADNLKIAITTDEGERLFGETSLESSEPVLVDISASGLSWTLAAIPAGGWVTTPPDLRLIWALITCAAIVAMMLKHSFDWITAKGHRAETQLFEAMEALDDGFALFDKEDRLIVCNERYKQMYSASADAMIHGRKFEEIIRYGLRKGQYKDAQGQEEAWLKKRLELHRRADRPMEQRLNSGQWLRVVERRTPSGNTVGFRVDITELKEALAKAELASAAKTDFLNTVSHELRTPLSVVLGYNAFLRNPDKLPSYKALQASLQDPEKQEALKQLHAYQANIDRFSKQIESSGQQLMGLISGILDLAAIEEGTLQLKRESVCLRQVSDDVAEQLRPIADAKQLGVTVSGDAGTVYADPLRLRQILSNLIVNAIKFTDQGKISIELGTDGRKAWVDVTDTGRGIAETDLEVIFDRFGQLDAYSNREQSGVGLGLPISRELAELHGGRVEVTSVKGKGSTFRLELICYRAMDEAAA